VSAAIAKQPQKHHEHDDEVEIEPNRALGATFPGAKSFKAYSQVALCGAIFGDAICNSALT
jgi:hypothetical protein